MTEKLLHLTRLELSVSAIRAAALLAATQVTRDNDPIRAVEFAAHFENYILGTSAETVVEGLKKAFYVRTAVAYGVNDERR